MCLRSQSHLVTTFWDLDRDTAPKSAHLRLHRHRRSDLIESGVPWFTKLCQLILAHLRTVAFSKILSEGVWDLHPTACE